MNKMWVLATEQQMSRFFRLPTEVVANKSNRLWGSRIDLSAVFVQPPLSFIADFKADLPAQFTRLVIKTIQEESQGGTDSLNPLEALGRCSMSLKTKEIQPTLEVVSEIANSLPNGDDQIVFERLTEETELKKVGLNFRDSDRISIYTFKPYPDLPDDKQAIYPIIRLVRYEDQGGIYFTMGYLKLSDLTEQKYEYPYAYGLHPGLYLTRNGILSVMELIKNHAQLT